jgi:mono/diheme cytochrome c family protein
MKQVPIVLVLLAVLCGSLPAQVTAGDAGRGEQLLREHGCIGCHEFSGQGGHSAPELGTRLSRNYSPASLIDAIWNHAPSMWAQAGAQRDISEEEAADLFAYFLSHRYFDYPGNAARGKQVFAAKHCAGCHGLSNPLLAEANPITAWRSIADPIALAQAAWNRPQLMVRAFERKGIECPKLTSQELTDVLVYIENLPATRGRQPRFRLASPQAGRALFQTKACAGCHSGKLSLENRFSRLTPVDIAAAMWNHAPGTAENHPPLSYEEMSGLVSYLWSLQAGGDPHRGRQLLASKKCAGCHGDAAAAADKSKPHLAAEGQLVPAAVVTALWSHGPSMQAEMRKQGLSWPRLTDSEVANLAAYLTNRPLPARR